MLKRTCGHRVIFEPVRAWLAAAGVQMYLPCSSFSRSDLAKADSWRSVKNQQHRLSCTCPCFYNRQSYPGGSSQFASFRLPPNRRPPPSSTPILRRRLRLHILLCCCIQTLSASLSASLHRPPSAAVLLSSLHCISLIPTSSSLSAASASASPSFSGKRTVSALHIPTFPVSPPLSSESSEHRLHRSSYLSRRLFSYLFI
ncbi:hypothetical protein F4860DRAFT_260942 [Xylaria cubensis]|nr:hypothetical protein F4860DRAFT_260942 [Xylaria cubensis]